MKFFKINIFLIVIISLLWITYLFIIPNVRKKETIVPNLINLDVSEAKKVIKRKKLKYSIIEIENENKSSVLYTRPVENTIVYEKSTIYLYVSTEVEKEIIDFKSMLYSDVKDIVNNECERLSLKLVIEYQQTSSFEDGTIINQIKDSEKLLLTISKNDDLILLDNLIGKKDVDSWKYLKEYNLNINYIYVNSFIEDGIIIGDNLKTRHVLKGNQSEINFYVSRGI